MLVMGTMTTSKERAASGAGLQGSVGGLWYLLPHHRLNGGWLLDGLGQVYGFSHFAEGFLRASPFSSC